MCNHALARISESHTLLRIPAADRLLNEQIARTEKQLGAILRRVRRQAGLTQAALGERTHLRQATLSRLEAGEPALQIRTLMAALAALDLELVVRPRSRSAADIADIF